MARLRHTAEDLLLPISALLPSTLKIIKANDESLLTSKDRKTVFLKLVKRYEKLISGHE